MNNCIIYICNNVEQSKLTEYYHKEVEAEHIIQCFKFLKGKHFLCYWPNQYIDNIYSYYQFMSLLSNLNFRSAYETKIQYCGISSV